MTGLALWMRAVGALYVFLFVAAVILRLPIRVEGPPGLLDLAASGDAVALFAVDSWVMIGLFLGVIGTALLVYSRKPFEAPVLVQTVLAGELTWGIGIDLFKIVRGYDMTAPSVWIVIHAVIIATGWFFFRKTRQSPAASTPLTP